MSRARILYLSVLIIAVLALIWDKTSNDTSITEPQSTQAQTASPPEAVIPVNSSTKNEKTAVLVYPSSWNPMPTGQESPSQSKSWDHPHETGGDPRAIRNLFAVSESFRTVTRKKEKPQPEEDILELAGQLRLSGTLAGGQKRCALINDQVVFPGDLIGSYILAEIGPDYVILGYGRKQIKLVRTE